MQRGKEEDINLTAEEISKIWRTFYLGEYRKKNKGRIRETRVAHYIKNKEKIIQKSKDWYNKNKEKVKEYNQLYYQDNKKENLEYKRRKRAERRKRILKGRTYREKEGVKERKRIQNQEREKREDVRTQRETWSKSERAKILRARRQRKVGKIKRSKRRKWARGWAISNPEKIKDYRLKYQEYRTKHKEKINALRRERYEKDKDHREARLGHVLKDRIGQRIKKERPKTVEEFLFLGGKIERTKERKLVSKNVTMVKLQSFVSMEEFDFIVSKKEGRE